MTEHQELYLDYREVDLDHHLVVDDIMQCAKLGSQIGIAMVLVLLHLVGLFRIKMSTLLSVNGDIRYRSMLVNPGPYPINFSQNLLKLKAVSANANT